MGIRINKPELIEALQGAAQSLQRRDEAVEQASKACDGLIGDDTLTGEAWTAAKADTKSHQKHDAQRLLEQDQRLAQACHRAINLAGSLLHGTIVDEDALQRGIANARADDAMLDDIPQDGAIGWNMSRFIGQVHEQDQRKIRLLKGRLDDLREFDRRLQALARSLDQEAASGDGEHAGDANAVMAKLVTGNMSKADLTQTFEQMGMSMVQAEELAEFTIDFRNYAKKKKGYKGWKTNKDILWQYARLIAATGKQYGGPLWGMAGGVPSGKKTIDMLAEIYGGGAKGKAKAQKLVDDLRNYHDDDEDEHNHHLPDRKEDFVHEMASLACMLNTGGGAGAYHRASESMKPVTKLGPFGQQIPVTGPDGEQLFVPKHDWYQEAASWGGDIASGNANNLDLKDDMDAININARINANPNADPIAIVNQYHADVESGKTDRVTDFCAHYGNGDPNKGRKYLHDHLDEIVDEPLGDQAFHLKDHGGDPASPGGPSKTDEAKQRFLDIIDGKAQL